MAYFDQPLKFPTAATESAIKALENAFVAATDPLMKDFAPAAKAFAEAVNSYVGTIRETAAAHPYGTAAGLAAGVGAVGYGAIEGTKALARMAGREIAKGAGLLEEAAPEIAAQAPRAGAGWLSTILGAPLAYFGSTTGLNEGEDERARQLLDDADPRDLVLMLKR